MIYIHIPFCKSRCLYCDFFSTTSLSLREDFVKALLKEIEGRAEELRRARANTIYIGGGTPSQLDVRHLTEIFDALQRVSPLQEGAEVTIECNPDSITEDSSESFTSLYSLLLREVGSAIGEKYYQDGMKINLFQSLAY